MGARLKSWMIVGLCFVAALLVVVFVQPRSLHAQETSDRPPSLIDRREAFDIERPSATAFSIWNASSDQRHEVWFRIRGGDALFQQRLRVYKEQDLPRPPDTLPPSSELIYEIEGNRASDWISLGFEDEFYTYYFDGDNRPFGRPGWDHSKAVRAQKEIYNNGDLYRVSFEDLNTLDDYNDLEVEVVLVHGSA